MPGTGPRTPQGLSHLILPKAQGVQQEYHLTSQARRLTEARQTARGLHQLWASPLECHLFKFKFLHRVRVYHSNKALFQTLRRATPCMKTPGLRVHPRVCPLSAGMLPGPFCHRAQRRGVCSGPKVRSQRAKGVNISHTRNAVTGHAGETLRTL